MTAASPCIEQRFEIAAYRLRRATASPPRTLADRGLVRCEIDQPISNGAWKRTVPLLNPPRSGRSCGEGNERTVIASPHPHRPEHPLSDARTRPLRLPPVGLAAQALGVGQRLSAA